ncbi:hypothetical protein M0R72_07410 [Candidatus Pacearchaeota archaeon]|jgi:hypothetical protein|nr:hypothetical protein [Candidatus Pacearchaeota archaeon]
MKVGSIGWATQSGLGILAKAFYDHGVVNRMLVIQHPHYDTHWDWYPTQVGVDRFLDELNVLLLFETAIDWNVAKKAKAKSIPIVLMPMYEWTPPSLPVPIDLYLCPSLLDLRYYEHKPSRLGAKFIPVPVEKPWKLRTKALHFVHNAGHGGSGFRNGTPELLQALPLVGSPIRLTVRGQPGIRGPKRARASEDRVSALFRQAKDDPRLDLQLGDFPYDSMFEEGDVFVFPEKFNGLSLPLQEAHASGMLVMASNRFPSNTWLPTDPLIPIHRYREEQIAVLVESAIVEPREIAYCIDTWYNRNIEEYSIKGKQWAEANSWEVLKPQYLSALEQVCGIATK